MAQLRVAALLASLLPGLGGCLLYTDDINGAPMVAIDRPAMEPFRGEPLLITARVTDEEAADGLEVTWVETEGACPKDPSAPPANQENGMSGKGKLQYSLKIVSFGKVCLFVRATDSMGAPGPWRHLEFLGKNRDPTAGFEVFPAPGADGSIPIYSRVVLSAANSMDLDGDELEYRWQITSPDGPVDKAACAAGMPESARCFVPRKSGRYTVQLVVAERLPPGEVMPAVSKPKMLALNVDRDRPPCLELTEPAVYQNIVLIPPGTKRIFEVSSVRDDGEPYPGPGENGEATFVWSITKFGTTALERTALTGPTFDVAESLFGNARPGDQFRVRVEARDKRWESDLGAGLVGAPCPEGEAVCRDMSGKDGSTCVRWATWTVQFHP